MSEPGEDLQRRFYEMLMRSQWWSAEALLTYQQSQLAQLLLHARQNVPFYRNRLDAVLDAEGDIDWTRWTELPVVRRRDMIEHRDAMLAAVLPAGHGPVADLSTSGSTSLPITIRTTALVTLASNGCRWRAQRWNGVDWSQPTARVGGKAPLEPPFGLERGHWGPPWESRRGVLWEINARLGAEQTIRFLRDHDCRYLITSAAPVHVLALETERLGLERPRLDLVLAQGASVGQRDRDAVRRVFKAPIMETYSSKEGGQMAQPCERGRLHINVETCLVEIVDANDQPVREGEAGRVLVTPFFSTGQPLIRYEQGDIARLGGACSCGRHSPTLLAIEGRHSIFFVHPDGRKATSLLPEEGRQMLDCTFWQIAQVGPLDFEVRYVPHDWDRAGDEDALVALFRKQYFADARVTFRRLSDIPLSASGKYIEYRQEYDLAQNA